MFKRVIVATDLSPASDGLIVCLSQLKQFHTKECLLLQCLSVQETASIAMSATTSVLEESLARQKALLESYGFAVETRTLLGQMKNEINQIAQKGKYTLLIAGFQRQSAASEFFFKDLAHELAQNARIPLLLIPLGQTEKGISCLQPLYTAEGVRILFPTDFSRNANLAFENLINVVYEPNTHITLMHVPKRNDGISTASSDTTVPQEEIAEMLGVLRTRLLAKGADQVDIHVERGNPAEVILRKAKVMHPNLIIMGSQGKGFVREIFLGSVTRYIMRHGDFPILLVPDRR